MKNLLIYQIIDKYAEFIKPPWLLGKASASNQGGARVIFIVYNIIVYNIILYNIILYLNLGSYYGSLQKMRQNY